MKILITTLLVAGVCCIASFSDAADILSSSPMPVYFLQLQDESSYVFRFNTEGMDWREIRDERIRSSKIWAETKHIELQRVRPGAVASMPGVPPHGGSGRGQFARGQGGPPPGGMKPPAPEHPLPDLNLFIRDVNGSIEQYDISGGHMEARRLSQRPAAQWPLPDRRQDRLRQTGY